MTLHGSKTTALLFRRFRLQKTQKANRYVIVLPQIPDCNPSNNEFLRFVEANELPSYDQEIKFKDATEGTAKLAMEYEMFFHDHCKNLEDVHTSKTFSTVIQPLCEKQAQLDYAWGTLRHLFMIANFKEPEKAINSKIRMKGIKKLVARSLSSQISSGSFYRAVKEVMADPQLLGEWQMRLCTRYIKDAEFNGVNLNIDDTQFLADARKKLGLDCGNFWLNVEQSSVESCSKVSEPRSLKDAPHSLLYEWSVLPQMYLRGPYYIPNTDASYLLFLQYCSDRSHRFRHYYFWNCRASFKEQTSHVNNSILVEEIRINRSDDAKVAGYDSFAELAMSIKMAYSLDEVEQFLTNLGSKCKTKFASRLEDMRLFARKNDMVGENLKPWDYYYYARKLIECATRFDSTEFAGCLPFERTWRHLLALTEKLLQIHYVDISDKVPRWHPSVKVLSVRDSVTGEEKGLMYVDYMARLGKMQANFVSHGRSKDETCGYKPIAYLNFNAVTDNNPDFIPLSLHLLIFLAKSLGDALSIVLSDSPYAMLSGGNSSEADGEHLGGLVLKWLVLQPQVLSRLSGGRLSPSDADIAREVFIESSLPSMLRDVLLSEFDLVIHCSPTLFWKDIYKDLHKRYYGKELDKHDNFPCSFVDIMVEHQGAASYYGRLWSEMVACDMAAAFNETDSFNKEDVFVANGSRLRQTLFSQAGSVNTRQIFQQFRGRDLNFRHLDDFYKL